MSWRALFVDGPMAGPEHDRVFLGAWQRELYFIPHPDVGDGWILIGTDHFRAIPDWPEQIHYVRNEERSQLLPNCPPGEDEGWAVFELAD